MSLAATPDGRRLLDRNTPPRRSTASFDLDHDDHRVGSPYEYSRGPAAPYSSSKHRSSNNIALLSRSSSLLRSGPNASVPPSPSPPPLSSPSIVSSLASSHQGFSYSPLRRELSQASLHGHHAHDEYHQAHAAAASSPSQLARRLAQLAHRIAQRTIDDADESSLSHQVAQLEKALDATSPRPSRSHGSGSGSGSGSDPFNSSPSSSPFRSRYSDLSASLQREREAERQLDLEEPPPQIGMTVQQANKVIAEVAKLNDELSAVINNLRARQEESDHIHGLLVERAERAAQRIMFLQNRIAYLEAELAENDDELQHLRICLKAVEIQMPPHPDKELQRCITRFKQDYQALKEKRTARPSSLLSYYDSPPESQR
ncbi:hypothetical protein CDD82_4688 [Ophiocordyceps australis]|uniref:Uncharacterized protein n=1 Tax=Ophiocordyceps australis TaxID=1399860 RepID=A0A2C5ZS61_9HYPO|nr:hypothetical protein CDD82_4688 [Ophiocordyceps australis]